MQSPRKQLVTADTNFAGQLLTRGDAEFPDILPSASLTDYKILHDIATTYHFRPWDAGGARIEKEIANGQRVVHAYGQGAGGFSYNFGVARAASELIAQLAYELPIPSRL